MGQAWGKPAQPALGNWITFDGSGVAAVTFFGFLAGFTRGPGSAVRASSRTFDRRCVALARRN